ncbi:hypothetical protein [Roseovarius aestuariivivens]|uniref:hypothetical protein n=1 Tax=Roseovarius aestuariivivens TaxID=1888910 RepID=UPI00107FD5CE|nr:hypothetical protein [Roseovarius aestuariivivens]
MNRYTMASYEVLDTVMQEDPNWGTLERAVDATNPGWGGTWETAESMCNYYGPSVADLPRGQDPVGACKIYAAAEQHARFGDPLFYWYQNALKHGRYPGLDRFRLSLATSTHTTREDAEFAHEYLKDLLDGDGWNLHRAEAFDRNIAPKFGYPLIAEAHYHASQKGARERLSENPYDDKALNGLRLRLHSYKEIEPFTFEEVVVAAPDPAEEIEYVRRLLEIRPYDDGLWSDCANLAYPLTRPKALALRDGPLINAIAYSNHGPYHLNTFNSSKLIMLNIYEKRELKDRGEAWRKARNKVDLAEDILCPMARVQRLIEAVCSVDDSGFCETSSFERREAQKKLANYGAKEVCKAVYDAPLEDLVFLPVQVDLLDADG